MPLMLFATVFKHRHFLTFITHSIEKLPLTLFRPILDAEYLPIYCQFGDLSRNQDRIFCLSWLISIINFVNAFDHVFS